MDEGNKKYHDKYCDIKYWYDNEINKYSLSVAVLSNKISEITSLIDSYLDNSVSNQHDNYNLDNFASNSDTHLLQNNYYMNESNHSTRKSMVERQNVLIVLQPKMYNFY